MASTTPPAPAGRQPSQYLALAIGALYTVAGPAGFLVTGLDDWVGDNDDDDTLLGFGVNPTHNLVHLAFGLAGLVMWSRLERARAYGCLLAAGFALMLLYGLLAAIDEDLNFLSLNAAGNVLHLLSLLAGLLIALWPCRGSPQGQPSGMEDEPN